ncbi:hypothetical protein TC41_3179 [Alicyclobacillus acidocaldarius subsp. acidocaldarius Tc-4-1]|uniref:Uncharacterized protein n=1 Tax=Alicyclobacillus acidocaldarius (strain Tc-4-1) TaxID=1048834 RepID=F8IDL7_ALIAT|nr:hypothetical protein TC41_3179 [Alicyclobacillus acidocaldarius subsp. acidocaldarius Tc-4-1]
MADCLLAQFEVWLHAEWQICALQACKMRDESSYAFVDFDEFAWRA